MLAGLGWGGAVGLGLGSGYGWIGRNLASGSATCLGAPPIASVPCHLAHLTGTAGRVGLSWVWPSMHSRAAARAALHLANFTRCYHNAFTSSWLGMDQCRTHYNDVRE